MPSEFESIFSGALEFFEKSVRPVLADNCFTCHGADKQEGGSGETQAVTTQESHTKRSASLLVDEESSQTEAAELEKENECEDRR